MTTPLVTRLKEFLDHKDISVLDLQKALRYASPQKIYRLFNTLGANPSVHIIEDISNAFPELNLTWLVTGEGVMIKTFSDDMLAVLKFLKEDYEQNYMTNHPYYEIITNAINKAV